MMKKLSFYLIPLLMVFVYVGYALATAWQAPTNQNGAAHDSSIAPALSSATAITNAMSPFSGPGTVYGVVLASNATSGYIQFRDSGTANTTSALLVKVQNSTTDLRVQFNPPLRVYNGLSVDATVCLGSTQVGTNWCYTVLYDTLER